MTKYQLELDFNYGKCGDGCCSWDETKISVSGIEIGWYGGLYPSDLESLEAMVTELNERYDYYELIYTIENDKDEDLDDAIYLNNKFLGKSTSLCEVYEQILEKLNIKYKLLAYDYNWDIWKNEKRIELELVDY